MSVENDSTIFEVWDDVKSHKWMVLGCLIVIQGIAISVAWLSPEIYRAEVTMVPAEKGEDSLLQSLSGRLGGLGGFIPGRAGESNTVAEAIAVLVSRSFTQELIEQEKLMPVLFSGRWDSVAGGWSDDEPVPSMNDGFRLFDRTIREVEHDLATGLIILSVEWREPYLAAQWANLLVERVNERARVDEIAKAELSLQYLNDELSKATVVSLQQAIYALIQDQINTIMVANVRKEYAFRVIDPAVAPDPEDFVRPNRLLIVVAGFTVGVVAGVFVALIGGAFRRAKSMNAKLA